MEIIFYRNNAEKEKVDKTSELVEISTENGYFRDVVDVQSPIFRLEIPFSSYLIVTPDNDELVDEDDNEIILPSLELPIFNYCYIPDLHRYYFVTSISLVPAATKDGSRRLYDLSLTCDVLMSFKDEIYPLRALIARNEFLYDMTLPDEKMTFEPTQQVEYISLAAGALVNTQFKANSLDKNIAVSVAAQGSINRSIAAPTGSNLPTIDTGNFAGSGGNCYYTLNKTNFENLVLDLLGDYSAYSTFFISAVAFPFELAYYPAGGDLIVWKKKDGLDEWEAVNMPNVYAYFSYALEGYLVIADFVLPSISSYLDNAPFVQYEVYLPFYGYHEIDIRSLAGDRLIVFYSCDVSTGGGEVYLYDMTKGLLLFSSNVQLGVTLSITSGNAQELARQKEAMTSNLILGLISSGLSVGAGVVKGNPLAVVGGLFSGTQQVINYNNQAAMMFEKANATHNGVNGGIFSPLSVYLKRKTLTPLISDLDDFAHSFGLPYMQYGNLSQFSGRTICADVHIKNFSGMTEERTEIETLLKAGVLL